METTSLSATKEKPNILNIILLAITMFLAGFTACSAVRDYREGLFFGPERRFEAAKQRFAKEYLHYLYATEETKKSGTSETARH